MLGVGEGGGNGRRGGGGIAMKNGKKLFKKILLNFFYLKKIPICNVLYSYLGDIYHLKEKKLG